MIRVPLSSNAIVSAGYDPETEQLEIEFRGGRVYRYSSVPEGVYVFLLRTPNKGAYVHRMIEGRYRHRATSPATAEQDLLGALEASLNEASDRDRSGR